uniref:Arp2/3 complex 41 kDa subunit n=1 Tax=Arcella intermedia TaxID=1963864 RepID=A0A6B2LJN3_9EUKA
MYKVTGNHLHLVHTLKGHDSPVTCVDWAGGCDKIVSTASDKWCCVWVYDVERQNWRAQSVQLRQRSAGAIHWSPREDKFVITSSSGLNLCHFETFYMYWWCRYIPIEDPSTPFTAAKLNCVCWHPDNILVGCGGMDTKVRVFSTYHPADSSNMKGLNTDIPFGTMVFSRRANGWINTIR